MTCNEISLQTIWLDMTLVQRDRRDNKNKPAKLMGRKRLTEYDCFEAGQSLKVGVLEFPWRV